MPSKRALEHRKRGEHLRKQHLAELKRHPRKLHPNQAILAGILIALLGLSDLFAEGPYSMWFWLFFVIGALIVLPNAILLKYKKGAPTVPYFITMLKTKHFINGINSISRKGWIFEKISLGGTVLGFGLVAVDYFWARKRGGWKRIAILAVAAVILGAIFMTTMSFLFSVPLFAPLFIPCLLGFVLLGFGGMMLALLMGYAGLSIVSLFKGGQICPSIAPVLPGVPMPGLGVILPWIAWISLFLVLAVHELSHGVLMRYYKEKIKSVGLLLAGIIPIGAFVEQDDKTFKKLEDKKALMVLGAGASINLFSIGVGLALMAILSFSLVPLAGSFSGEFEKMYYGVKINSVQESVDFCGVQKPAPAFGKLLAGDQVLAVNGVDVNSIAGVNVEFAKAGRDLNFKVLRDGNTRVVPLRAAVFEDFNLKRIGVEFGSIPTGYEPPPWMIAFSVLVSSVSAILLYFVVLSFAAGSFNFVPADIIMPGLALDGSYMAKIMLLPYFSFMGFKSKEETQLFIGRLFYWIFNITLLLNLIPYLTMII